MNILTKPRLSIKSISKNFGNNSVLKEVSLDLFPGEITSFIGANGAGKTTLVKILAGIHKFEEGKIEIDGLNYSPINPTDAMRKGIAIVHQIISDGVIEDMTVESSFGIKYISQMCQFYKITDKCEIHISNGIPLLFKLDIDNESLIRFYVAPKIKD